VQQDSLESFEVDLPELSEQRAIAATLGALDDKIESNRRAIAVMEELAHSTFEQIFDLEQVGDGVALSELVNVNLRRVLRPGTPATYVGMSSLPEFSAEVYIWETREAGSGQRFVSGDVLMARITPCLENGKTAVVDMLQPDEVGWGSTEYVVLSPAGLFSTPWIYCLVRDERIRDFAIRSMTGTSGRQRFQADRFSQYRIVPPETADLVRFNAVAEPLFTKMTQLRDETLKLATLRDTLLPELLSGHMRIPAEGVVA
jgi:type I restriction enzyme S subunit